MLTRDTISPSGLIIDLSQVIHSHAPGPQSTLKSLYQKNPLTQTAILSLGIKNIISAEFCCAATEHSRNGTYDMIEYTMPEMFDYLYDKMSPGELSAFELVIDSVIMETDQLLFQFFKHNQLEEDYATYALDRWFGPTTAFFVNPSLRGALHEGPLLPRDVNRRPTKKPSVSAFFKLR